MRKHHGRGGNRMATIAPTGVAVDRWGVGRHKAR